MSIEEMQEEFKRILEYGYHRGNECNTITTRELVDELSELLRSMLEKSDSTIMR